MRWSRLGTVDGSGAAMAMPLMPINATAVAAFSCWMFIAVPSVGSDVFKIARPALRQYRPEGQASVSRLLPERRPTSRDRRQAVTRLSCGPIFGVGIANARAGTKGRVVAFRKEINDATKFIPLWVKVAVAPKRKPAEAG
jgi:hypothetical protein